MTNSEYLIQAKALIDRPEKWTKHRMRADVMGHTQYCILGAVHTVVEGVPLLYNSLWAFLDDLKPHGWREVTQFNDASGRTHAEIMAFMDQAIAAAEAQEMYTELAKPAPEEAIVAESIPEEVAA